LRISLIGTVHAESGRANVAVLQAILDRLQPETIFAEISANSLPEYLDGSDGNLESRAVAVYRKQHLIDVEPVDSKKPRDEFFRESQEMFEKVERTSLVYRRLLDQHSLYTRNHGFTYLNSDRCAQLWTDI
jgi:transcriptional regulator of aromatic amino acid metabolism